MTKKVTHEAPPGLAKLDALLTKTLTASNKDVRAKMDAEKRARKRKRGR
jgi:hypothetical protein